MQQATSLILIETNGTVKSLKAKDVTIDTLYKKCGFRTNDDFTRQHTWEVKLTGSNVVGAKATKHIISVWAKKVGKANFENKYDFPPPIDTALFFGTCAVVQTDEAGNLIDLTKETWEKIYEKLFGGFEDLDKSEEPSEDELEDVDPSLLTANGYLKDGFVVSDKDSVENSEEDTESVSKPVLKKKSTVVKEKKEKKVVEKKDKKVVTEPKVAVPKVAVPKVAAAKEKKPSTTKPSSAKPSSSKPSSSKPSSTSKPSTKPSSAKPSAKKSAPAPIDHESEDEETVSELEEEVYTFSDEE